MMVQSYYIYKDPTCCYFGALYGFTLGTYNDTELGSLEGSIEGIVEGKFEGLLLSA